MVFLLAEWKLVERAAFKTSNQQISGESWWVGKAQGRQAMELEVSPGEDERPGRQAEALGQG